MNNVENNRSYKNFRVYTQAKGPWANSVLKSTAFLTVFKNLNTIIEWMIATYHLTNRSQNLKSVKRKMIRQWSSLPES